MEFFHTTSVINATLSIVLPATEGLTHFLMGAMASYSLTPTAGRLMVLDSSTVIFDIDIAVQNPMPFTWPVNNLLHGTQSNALEVRLGAGGLLNMGKLDAFGVSRF